MYRHSADDIKESKRRLFCTPEQVKQWDSNNISVDEREYWNSKAEGDHTHDSIGGVPAEELSNIKLKLEGIEEGANRYVHPNNELTRHVTDEQIQKWDNKADADHTHEELGDIFLEEVINVIDKVNEVENIVNGMNEKLDGIEEGANRYVHPDNELIRHVTDEQIRKWDDVADSFTNTGGIITSDPYNGVGNLIKPTDATTGLDQLADSGKHYIIGGDSANLSINFGVEKLRLGKYICAMRVRCNNHPLNAQELFEAKIYKSDITNILASKVYSKTDVQTEDYSMVYLAFEYKAPKNNEDRVMLELAITNPDISIFIDYVEFHTLLPGMYY